MSTEKGPKITLVHLKGIIDKYVSVHEVRVRQAKEAVEVYKDRVVLSEKAYGATIASFTDPRVVLKGDVSTQAILDSALAVQNADKDRDGADRYYQLIAECSEVMDLAAQVQEWKKLEEFPEVMLGVVHALISAQEDDFAQTDPPPEPKTTHNIQPSARINESLSIYRKNLKEQHTNRVVNAEISKLGLLARQVRPNLSSIAQCLRPSDQPTPLSVNDLERLSEITYAQLDQVFNFGQGTSFNPVRRIADLMIRLTNAELFQNGETPAGYTEWLTGIVRDFREDTQRGSASQTTRRYQRDELVSARLQKEFTEWRRRPPVINEPPIIEIAAPPLPQQEPLTKQPHLDWVSLLGVDTTAPDARKSPRDYDDVLKFARKRLPDKPWDLAGNGKDKTAFRFLHDPLIKLLVTLTIPDVDTVYRPPALGREPNEGRIKLIILVYRAQCLASKELEDTMAILPFDHPHLVAAATQLACGEISEGTSILEQINQAVAALPPIQHPEQRPKTIEEPISQPTVSPEAYTPPEALPVAEDEIRLLIEYTLHKWCKSAASKDAPLPPNHLLEGLSTGIIAKIDGSFGHSRIDALAKARKLKIFNRQSYGGLPTYTAQSVLWEWMIATCYPEGTKRNVGGDRLAKKAWDAHFPQMLTTFLTNQESSSQSK